MAADPVFAATPRHESVAVSATASTERTGTPVTVVTLLTAGASGTKIESLVFEGTGTTLSGVIVVWLYDGATYQPIFEELVTVVAASTTAIAYRQERLFDTLLLKSTESLRLTSQVASQLVRVHAFGGDF